MDRTERLLELIERLITEQAETNQFLAQIVAHNTDMMEATMESDDDEPTTYLNGKPIQDGAL